MVYEEKHCGFEVSNNMVIIRLKEGLQTIVKTLSNKCRNCGKQIGDRESILGNVGEDNSKLVLVKLCEDCFKIISEKLKIRKNARKK